MIAARLFNLRAYKKALEFCKKNHNVLYLLYKYNNQMYAIEGVTLESIETIPQFYTQYLYFWRRTRPQLLKYFNNKIIFVGIPEFLSIVNEKNQPFFEEMKNEIS